MDVWDGPQPELDNAEAHGALGVALAGEGGWMRPWRPTKGP